jgi:hypothetical protein
VSGSETMALFLRYDCRMDGQRPSWGLRQSRGSGEEAYGRDDSQRAVMQQHTDGLKIAGAFAAIYVLWGGTYLAIALGLQSIPAFILIASRSLIGGGVLLLVSYFRGSGLRPLSDWGHAAIGGAFFSSAATALSLTPSARFHPASQRSCSQQSHFGSSS